MAKLIGTMKDFPKFSYPEGMKAQEDAMDALERTSQSLPEGEVVGGILCFPVADGHAIYRVVKAKPLCLEHIRGYSISDAHMRGLRVSDVLALLARDRLICDLFPGNKK